MAHLHHINIRESIAFSPPVRRQRPGLRQGSRHLWPHADEVPAAAVFGTARLRGGGRRRHRGRWTREEHADVWLPAGYPLLKVLLRGVIV